METLLALLAGSRNSGVRVCFRAFSGFAAETRYGIFLKRMHRKHLAL